MNALLGEQIHLAASTFDGHVTNGSHEEVMKVVREAIRNALENAYTEARGTEKLKPRGNSQMYWAGRADAAADVRAYATELLKHL
jgi:hypothetical protein